MAGVFEDTRMTRLRQAMSKTVEGTMRGVSLDEFLACFPDLAETHPSMLAELFRQLNEAVRSNVMVRAPPSAPASRRTCFCGQKTACAQATVLISPSRVRARCSKSLTKFAPRWTW